LVAAALGRDREDQGEPHRPITLEGVALGWFGHLLPTRPRPFLVVAGMIAAVCWGLGYLLAGDRNRFLEAHEWQAQPFFLAIHFIALRLFVAVYVGNFLAGTAHLDLPGPTALGQIRQILGTRGFLASVLVASYFCIKDLFHLHSSKYAEESALGPAGALCGADYLMGLIWCVEWILNAYIWVLIVGFLAVTMRTLLRHTFVDPVEVVLHEKQYRPFLMMSSQGASILLAFGVANAAYIWYTNGEITDYIGLGITVLLLFLSFVPPWMKIKTGVEGLIKQEIFRLRENLIVLARQRRSLRPSESSEAIASTGDPLVEVVAMLRIDYLDRLQQDMGKAEAKAVLLKLLAPASAIIWKYARTFVGM
jgi:hypothetical protein